MGWIDSLGCGVQAPGREPAAENIINRVPGGRRPKCPPLKDGLLEEPFLVFLAEGTNADGNVSSVAHGSSVSRSGSSGEHLLPSEDDRLTCTRHLAARLTRDRVDPHRLHRQGRRGDGPARCGGVCAMEILGIGTDIVECPRIGKMIEQHGELFLRRIYTEREIRYCQRGNMRSSTSPADGRRRRRSSRRRAPAAAAGSPGPTWRCATARTGGRMSWSAARRGRWRASGGSARSWSRSRTVVPMRRPMRFGPRPTRPAGEAGSSSRRGHEADRRLRDRDRVAGISGGPGDRRSNRSTLRRETLAPPSRRQGVAGQACRS